jgi:hypothetical protein
VVEPPKLYGPHAPVVVLKTSKCCTREPDNSGNLSGVLVEPRIIHILQLIQYQQGVSTTLQHYNITTLQQGVRKIYNSSIQNMSKLNLKLKCE